jgi:hypothetical protein
MQTILAHNTVQSTESQWLFQVTISPTSSALKNKSSIKQVPTGYLLHVGFLLVLFFDPKHGKYWDGTFLWNVDWLSADYKVLYPRI